MLPERGFILGREWQKFFTQPYVFFIRLAYYTATPILPNKSAGSKLAQAGQALMSVCPCLLAAVNCCSGVIPSSSYAEAHLVCLQALTVRLLGGCQLLSCCNPAHPGVSPAGHGSGMGAFPRSAAAPREFHTDISRFLKSSASPKLQNTGTWILRNGSS